VRIRAFRPEDEAAVVSLWHRCELLRPWNDPHADIRRKLRVQPELFIVGTAGDEIVARAMAGYDGHRGWVYYFAVTPERQRQGLGRAMMAEVERRLAEAGCPKINLQVRGSNTRALGFYRRLGYGVDDTTSLGKRLVEDDSG